MQYAISNDPRMWGAFIAANIRQARAGLIVHLRRLLGLTDHSPRWYAGYIRPAEYKALKDIIFLANLDKSFDDFVNELSVDDGNGDDLKKKSLNKQTGE